MEIVQIIHRISHGANAVQNPFAEREALFRIGDDLRVPFVSQAALQFHIDVTSLNRFEFNRSRATCDLLNGHRRTPCAYCYCAYCAPRVFNS
jgi:hypothetical protein